MANIIKGDFYEVKIIFWANSRDYDKWPYEDRRAIGVNLRTSWFRDFPVWHFLWKGTFYSIAREKAIKFGKKWTCPGGILPNLIPLEACEKLKHKTPRVEVYDFDNKTNTAILKQ